LRQLRYALGNETLFKGRFDTWADALACCSGYTSENILSKVIGATLKVKQGDALFERDSVLFFEPDYNWPLLTGLMLAATRNNGQLNVLDFGGALGSVYYQNRHFLQSLQSTTWNIVEQSNFVEAGRCYIHDDTLRFFNSIDECVRENSINAILLSSVLQYIQDIDYIFYNIKNIGAEVIVIDRTIINNSSQSPIYVQHVPSKIYSASYPCRSISEEALLNALLPDYSLLADFPSLNFHALRSIKSYFKGYIFKRSVI